jgi:hypothetical protein
MGRWCERKRRANLSGGYGCSWLLCINGDGFLKHYTASPKEGSGKDASEDLDEIVL